MTPMTEILTGAISALWLGLLTSLSPCPLATNIAAISYTTRSVSRTPRVFLSGVIYTFGRMLLYISLGILIMSLVFSIPQLSFILQKYMNRVLGPLLIVVGLVLLEVMKFDLPGFSFGEKARKYAETSGLWGAFLLGILFALSFCPISAALFFGSLIPLSIKCKSQIVLPAIYGLGTGLPVILSAVLVSAGLQSIGKAFDKMRMVELWFRRSTGLVLILLGVYFSLVYNFHILQD
jgi:cytochrome c-type biogenesis protein